MPHPSAFHPNRLAALAIVLTFAASAFADAPMISWRYAAWDAAALLDDARAGRPLELSMLGTRFTVDAKPAEVRTGDFQALELTKYGLEATQPAPARSFKGCVDGDVSRSARLTFTKRGLSGYIETEAGRVFVEPYSADPDALKGGAIYHKLWTDDELDVSFRADCSHAAAHLEEDVSPRDTSLVPEASAVTTLRVVEIFAEADYELFRRYGADTTEHVESVFNNVSGIYESELGVELRLAGIRVWQTASDPFVANEATSLLADLREHWIANETARHRDTVHLITGRNLDGHTVGYAGVGVLCSERSGYGLTEDLESLGWTTLVVAHELGHNFGARHDASGSDYLMTPSLGSSTLREFSDRSIADIDEHLSQISCVDSIEAEPPPTPTIGNSQFVRGDFTSDGAVDLGDPIRLLDYLFRGGPPPRCADAADADDNGALDLGDAVRVIDHLLMGGAAPAAPYPAPGTDPSADRLPACE